MEFISKTDRLPSETGRVIVISPETEAEIILYVKFIDGIKHGEFRLRGNDVTAKVTHWMPLPKLSKKGLNQ